MSTIDLNPNPVFIHLLDAEGNPIGSTGGALNVSGSFSGGTVDALPSGLRTAGKITTLDVTDVVTAIPVTPLASRNALSLTNMSSSDVLYIGFHSGITASNDLGTNAGWDVGPNESFNIDITDDIILYAIASTGKTIRIKVMELS